MNSDIFSKVLDSLRTKISDFNFKNWFQYSSWHYEEPNRVIIKVPTKFIRDWLSDHYLELIKFELFRFTESEHEITFKVERNINKTLELFPEIAASAATGPGKKNDPSLGKIEPTAAKPSPPAFIGEAAKSPARPQPQNASHLGFNSKYSFENFVVGNANQLVHAACKAVSLHPAKSYNPLFIYGGVGLGKTHLLNAVGMEVIKNYPQTRVIFVTGERFTNEVIDAIRYEKTYELRKKYRDSCDMLLIDDIQFIAGKERTMEEFFHTFNTLYEVRKQIVLTSDRMPKDISQLEERLRSRFGWGLLADIQSPDFETRMAILRKKAEEDQFPLADDVCEFIAAHITTNIRELEGALVRVCAFASLAKLPVTLDLAREVLKNIISGCRPSNSIEAIQIKVAEFYQIRTGDLKSKRRHKNLAVPRQIAMYLCKKHLDVSFPEIGTKFGGKDHTTVMHAVQKITKCLIQNVQIKVEVQQLEKILDLAS